MRLPIPYVRARVVERGHIDRKEKPMVKTPSSEEIMECLAEKSGLTTEQIGEYFEFTGIRHLNIKLQWMQKNGLISGRNRGKGKRAWNIVRRKD